MRDDGRSDGRDGHSAPSGRVNSPSRQTSSRDNMPSNDNRRSPRPHQSSQRRNTSRDRSRDRPRDPPADSQNRSGPTEDLIPRFRAKQARESEPDKPTHRNRSRGRDAAGSPSSSRRHRSRSASRDSSHKKRSRGEHSSSRQSRDRDRDRGRPSESSRKRRRHSSHERRSSPRRHDRSHKSSVRSGRRHSKSRRHSYNRSPGPPEHDAYPPRPHDRRDSRSPSSRSRRQHSRDSQRHKEGDSSIKHYDEGRKRRDGSIDTHYSSRSGRDDDLARRTNTMHASRHSRSPPPHQQNFHNRSPSSYGAGTGRSNPNTQSNSPSHHTTHGMNEYGSRPPPTGPAADQNSFAPPSGPMSHFGRGGGGRGNFRGMAFAGRAPPRGPGSQNAFRGGQGGFNQFNRHDPADDSEYHRQTPENGYGRPDEQSEPMDVDMDSRGWNSSHDSSSDNRNSVHKPDPPKNAPSGPAAQSASKFSFAFKSTSKPTLAAPKPEISQKLNAAPRKPAIFQNHKVDRDPPPGAPTQPSNRGADMRKPPDGPRMAPRMRKVKKIVRKPRPRPTLASELVTSESVFYRKPGNGSVVGSGTYGKVFKGLNVYTKDSVALKKIRMEGERDGFPVTAVREIKLLQSLRHINIVNLQEVMVEQNDCFMVFEYLAYDLTGILHHPSFTLQAPQKKDLARQLFEGLDYLHTRGVLHRDIKAANILVGKDGILKIADFGLARFYAKHHQLEYTNRVITIWYRSPELLLGETKYTAAVDVWSAACVMMEIFTSVATFAGDGTELSQLEKIYSIMGTPNRQEWPGLVDMAWFELLRPAHKRKSVFAEKFQDKLTPAAFELMQSMFHYDPAKRPSAAEVLRHPYFTTEEPPAKQATDLSLIDGDWHEFESKALRKEKERKEREARKTAARNGTSGAAADKEKKRRSEGEDGDDETKRQQVDAAQSVAQ